MSATSFSSTMQVTVRKNSEMACNGLSNEDNMNLLLDSGGNQNDDLEDSENEYIPSDK